MAVLESSKADDWFKENTVIVAYPKAIPTIEQRPFSYRYSEALRVKETNICRKCGNTNLIRCSSLNHKRCEDCKTTIPWNLKPGQKRII